MNIVIFIYCDINYFVERCVNHAKANFFFFI